MSLPDARGDLPSLDLLESRFRGAIAASLDAFFLLEAVRDADGSVVDFRIVELNDRADDFLGSTRIDLIGRLACEVLPYLRTSGMLERFIRVVETGEGYEDEHEVKDGECTAKWIRHQVVRVDDGLAITSRDNGAYSAIHHGWLLPHSRLHVRNRFFSAVDGQTFRVLADRDANSEVHEAVGKMMRVSDLALHMIATSSNLATNLLLDLVGIETVQRALDELRIDGIDIRRGVEDERAFERGINNRVTADGLVQLLRLVAEERAFSPELSREMLGILHAQEFRNGIPARLPPAVRVAHKTGDISTVAHDAGVVYPPGRKPYVIAVLTEWEPEAAGRSATIAEVSHAVFELLTGEKSPGAEEEVANG